MDKFFYIKSKKFDNIICYKAFLLYINKNVHKSYLLYRRHKKN